MKPVKKAVPAAGFVTVQLVTDEGTTDLHVPPSGRWSTASSRHLSLGDYDRWAELVLSPEDFDAWLDLDPRIDDAQKFLAEWTRQVRAGAS